MAGFWYLPSFLRTSASAMTLAATGDFVGWARSLPLNSLNSTDLAPGSRAGKEATMARFSVPAFIRPSTLSNSSLRSSVTISSVSLSLTWKVSSSSV